ncbi:MAG: ABC transporter permease subunit [Thermoanaerobaculales bacterium]|nr:ABC transporter permease subunit [Thermoanaerobaculales bacterium]
MSNFFDAKGKDRIAAALIRGGGVMVILAVVAIVANIGLEALPLLGGASVHRLDGFQTDDPPLVVGTDPRQETPWVLGNTGIISFPNRGDREPLRPFSDEVSVVSADVEIHDLITILDDLGRIVVGKVRHHDRWEDDQRYTTARWRASADILQLEPGTHWTGATANADSDGNLLVLAWSSSQPPVLFLWDREDEFWERQPLDLSGSIIAGAVAEELGAVTVIDSEHGLRAFNQDRTGRWTEQHIEGLQGPISRVRYLIGGGTLVAAGLDGAISIVLSVPYIGVTNKGPDPLKVADSTIAPGETVVLPDDEIGQQLASVSSAHLESAPAVMTVVRSLPRAEGIPTAIAPSPRKRGFLVGGDTGHIALYHATSGRRLIDEEYVDGAITAVAMAPKANGLVAAAGHHIIRATIDNPHPETSLKTLFMPVWYEGYARPRLVWQSTGGSDAFEPKFSVVPLIFGTLKATAYAMIISIPLALLAALYVSQLGPAWFRSVVKPTVELMAAVPSVVVGFLAALWLAPRLEQALLGAIAGAFSLPIAVVLSLGLWRVLPVSARRRLGGAAELLVPLFGAAVVLGLVAVMIHPLEDFFFGGDFSRWLFTTAGFRYDQRNSLVVGIALGFAVIPVIFSISEDAFSAVPRSLVNASRALGATRWQTARSLVAPAAGAGVFSAVVLGLGRAVGETMIVLMAAGNTPLLDFSPFNGMRTMSAAIAVEIPEAPVGGTLFRVLFLTGFLLFAFTFVLTTLADQVGRVLRRKYGAQ